jgi:hypothetical protein
MRNSSIRILLVLTTSFFSTILKITDSERGEIQQHVDVRTMALTRKPDGENGADG